MVDKAGELELHDKPWKHDESNQESISQTREKKMEGREMQFEPAKITYAATVLGQNLMRLHRTQSILAMVKDGLHNSADPRRDLWTDVLTVAHEELDRLFDDLTVGKRV